MIVLLPCPFCGGKAEIAQSESSFIRCRKCGIESPFFDTGDEEVNNRKAAQFWNRRHKE